MLNVLDEFSHECLAIRVARKLKAIDVIDVLSDLFILRGVPAHIRSDNGPEFVAKALQEWIAVVGALRLLRVVLALAHRLDTNWTPTSLPQPNRLILLALPRGLEPLFSP
jgi:transposase InsO family protein